MTSLTSAENTGVINYVGLINYSIQVNDPNGKSTH